MEDPISVTELQKMLPEKLTKILLVAGRRSASGEVLILDALHIKEAIQEALK